MLDHFVIIVGHYCAGVLDDGDVMIWHVSVKLPPLRISSPLSGGQLQSKSNEISLCLYVMPFILCNVCVHVCVRVRACVCACVCMCVCLGICVMHIYMYYVDDSMRAKAYIMCGTYVRLCVLCGKELTKILY